MSIKILVIETTKKLKMMKKIKTKKIKMMMMDIVRRSSGIVMLFMEKMN